MNFDPMTGEPIETTPVQPEQPVPPTKKNWLLPVAIGGGVLLVVAVVVILIVSGIFTKPINQIAMATANTFDDAGGELGAIFTEVSEILLDESTTSIEMDIDGDDLIIECCNGKEEKQLNFTLDVSSAPALELSALLTDEKLKVKIPALTDLVFVYNYTEEPEGYAFEDFTDEDFEMLNGSLESIYNMEQNGEFSQAELKAVKDLLYTLEFEKIEKAEFEINGEYVDCKGYTTTLDEDFTEDLLNTYKDVYIAHMGEEYEDIIDEMIDELAHGYEEISDIEVDIYLYKKELAAIIITVDGYETEILFKGGDFRAQNITIAFDGEDIVEVEGAINDTVEEKSIFVEDEEFFSYTYDSQSGDFECYFYDGYYEYEIKDANITLKNGQLTLSADEVSIDDLDAKMELTIQKGAKIKKISGEEFDFGNASVSDLENLVYDELGEDLYDFVEDYSGLFY